MNKYLLMIALIFTGCTVGQPKVGTCYNNKYLNDKSNVYFYEVVKVTKVCPECMPSKQVEYLYTYPLNMEFTFRWVDSEYDYFKHDSLSTFMTDYTEVECPW